eukprot:GHVS01090309.1.p1 GENE.GHVS01090309.1~~GHVS01090309.1.p1  ORF type:complete len:582 (+),score=116.24 GHVS01090309.1:137-1882(+)
MEGVSSSGTTTPDSNRSLGVQMTVHYYTKKSTTTDNKPAVDLIPTKGDTVVVPVTFDSDEHLKMWDAIYEWTPFSNWLKVYAVNLSTLEGLRLRALRIISVLVTPAEGNIHKMNINADVVDKDGQQIEGDVTLRGSRCALVVMLRNTENSKDMCLFVKKTRSNLGQHEHLEIPQCTLDDTGRFVGPMAKLIEETLDIALCRSSAVSLTGLAFGAKSEGVSAMPDECDERVQIYLYRNNMSPESINALEQKIDSVGGRRRRMLADELEQQLQQTKTEQQQPNEDGYTKEDDNNTNNSTVVPSAKATTTTVMDVATTSGSPLKMVPLGDAWRSTSDAKSMVALFLVHELRYHARMPRYRTPRGVQSLSSAPLEPVEKKSALFSKVSALQPASAGVNIRLKVVNKIGLIQDVARRDGRRTKFAFLVVGDETGVVTLKAVNEQIDICQRFENESAIVVRNAKIDMSDGHMRLLVDRWGKIENRVDGDEPSDYDFCAKEDHDMSSTEYELVVLRDEEQMKRDDGMVVPVGGRRGGDRRGPRGGRMGRRGGRGGRGGGGFNDGHQQDHLVGIGQQHEQQQLTVNGAM